MENPEKTKSQFDQLQTLTNAELVEQKCKKLCRDKKNRTRFIRLLSALGLIDVKL